MLYNYWYNSYSTISTKIDKICIICDIRNIRIFLLTDILKMNLDIVNTLA